MQADLSPISGNPLATPEQVTQFWLREKTPKDWYTGGEALDQEIRDRFQATWEAARAHRLKDWCQNARGMLAMIILLDQFPRNMFRGSGKSFSTDAQARAIAKQAIERNWDKRIPEPERQFFYMPLMHAECLVDQDRCVRMILTRMPETGNNTLSHAQAHREVIRQYGRFPYRNEALGRASRPEERAYLDAGGYGYTVNSLKGAA